MSGNSKNQSSLTDVYIAVMGLTGSGKSTFINLAAQLQGEKALPVGHGLRSCTSEVAWADPFVMEGRRIYLIDTPGFDDSSKTETEVLHMIAAELEVSYRRGTLLHGVIYVHRISDIRVGGLAIEDFHIFRKMCGTETLRNVVIMTTMWGKVSAEEGKRRASELEEMDDFFKPALVKGARLVHQKSDTVQAARDIIRPILDNHPNPLKIQVEMGDEGKPFDRTETGERLDKRLAEMLEAFSIRMATILAAAEEARRVKDESAQKAMMDKFADMQQKFIALERERSQSAAAYEKLLERVLYLEEERRNSWCSIM